MQCCIVFEIQVFEIRILNTFEVFCSCRESIFVFCISNTFSAVFCCSTAWSTCGPGRGYLGVTAHKINDRTLKRHSAALACRRLTGSHTYDVLAEALSDIHHEYGND